MTRDVKCDLVHDSRWLNLWPHLVLDLILSVS
jgi:hypothetical protein